MKIKEKDVRTLCEKGMTTREIAKELKVSQGGILNAMHKFNIPSTHKRKGGSIKFVDLANKKFGRLTVMELTHKAGQDTSRCSMWKCQCDCGKIVNVRMTSLTSKLTKSCGCLRREKMFQGVGNLSKSYWNRIIKGAKLRKLDVSIDIEYAYKLFLLQNNKCALSGQNIQIIRDYTKHHSEHTASFDRINNDLGYIPGNVQWVHRDINIMRNNFSVEEFVEHCRHIWEHCRKTVQ